MRARSPPSTPTWTMSPVSTRLRYTQRKPNGGFFTHLNRSRMSAAKTWSTVRATPVPIKKSGVPCFAGPPYRQRTAIKLTVHTMPTDTSGSDDSHSTIFSLPSTRSGK